MATHSGRIMMFILIVVCIPFFYCLAGGCGETEIHKKSLNRKEALEVIVFPRLPATATNIFFT